MTGWACRFMSSGWNGDGSSGRLPAAAVLRYRVRSSRICSKAFRNIPSAESDESSFEEVQVLDPRHPLYGKSFRVVRQLPRRGGNFQPSYEVEYYKGTTLIIPIAATEYLRDKNDQTKLSIEALLDIISVSDCIHDSKHESEGLLETATVISPTADCRRRRGGSDGGSL